MATLYVEKVPDELYRALRARPLGPQIHCSRSHRDPRKISAHSHGTRAPAAVSSKGSADERAQVGFREVVSLRRRDDARGSRALRLIVPDANVAAKWLLPRANEPLVDEAFSLLKQYVLGQLDFIVPEFLGRGWRHLLEGGPAWPLASGIRYCLHKADARSQVIHCS